MKYYLSTFAGSAICGGFAFGIWPELWKTYGLMGGWLAATLIYKRQNKLFPFLKTFCARFCFINTKQNVHFALSDNMFF